MKPKLYGCLGCGELFKVEMHYGSEIKYTPCCGNTVESVFDAKDLKKISSIKKKQLK